MRLPDSNLSQEYISEMSFQDERILTEDAIAASRGDGLIVRLRRLQLAIQDPKILDQTVKIALKVLSAHDMLEDSEREVLAFTIAKLAPSRSNLYDATIRALMPHLSEDSVSTLRDDHKLAKNLMR